jgi:hypothetical protein
MTTARKSLTFRCRGHRNVKATHAKTLEWTRAGDISPRATCIVGVAADFDPLAMARLRGPLRITLTIPGTPWVQVVSATATPLAAVRDSLVVRRSDQRGGHTFAYGADQGAAGLDRGLVRALTDPQTTLEVTVEALAGGAPATWGALYLAFASGPPGGEAAARWVAADAVVPVVPTEGGLYDRILPRLLAGERIVLLGDPLERVTRRIAGAAHAAGVTVSPLGGVAGWQGVVAAAGLEGPLHLLLEPVQKAVVLRRALEAAGCAAAAPVMAVALSPVVLLETVRDTLGERPLILGRGLLTRSEEILRGTPGTLLHRFDGADRRRAEPLVLAVPIAQEEGAEEGALKALFPLFEELLRQGVSVRTLADAAARHPGISRRVAYQALQRWADALVEKEAGESP